MKKEIWKYIKGYEGSYQVSNFGRVRGLDRVIISKNRSSQKIKGKILKPGIIKRGQGYLHCELFKNGTGKSFLISRLVAEAFIPNPKNKPEVNHIDENPKNNKASNLEWSTRLENIRHGTGIKKAALAKLGRPNKKNQGEKHNLSKLTEKDVLQIYHDPRIRNEIAKDFNISPSYISQIKRKERWKYLLNNL